MFEILVPFDASLARLAQGGIVLPGPLQYTEAPVLTSSRLSDYSLAKELLFRADCKRRWQLSLPSSCKPVLPNGGAE